MTIDIDNIRAQFPSLHVRDDGKPRIYLDNPGGTQVPQVVIDAMTNYFMRSNANAGGLFQTSRETDAIIEEARQSMADFLNANTPDEIVFGQNMTTLTFHLGRSIARQLNPGDQIIVTRMDHDANIAPWLWLAEDNGCEVRFLDFDPETFEFAPGALSALLNEKTRLVCINAASNATGTISDIKTLTREAKAAGALVFIDAVQLAPHKPIDVQDIGCDFLLCSAYKFFGPHQGILWGQYDLLDELPAYRVRPTSNKPPGKFETGTPSFESMAGTTAAVNYLAAIGAEHGGAWEQDYPNMAGRRLHMHTAMDALTNYESGLTLTLLEGLEAIDGTTVVGLTSKQTVDRRVPTVSFIVDGHHPDDVAQFLGEANIFVWSGDFYANEVIDHLGLRERGGTVRVGLAHYNTHEEVMTFLEEVTKIAKT